MNLMSLLKSLDELLYEVMSWLVFYPITLWRTLRHPLRMMDYSDHELKQRAEDQYDDTVSPPLFLLISLLLSHAIELAVIGESPIVTNQQGLDRLVDDDTSLMMLRMVTFSIFPLVMATRLVRVRRKGLTRQTLKEPFYGQCYVAAPFALAMGFAGTLIQCHGTAAPIAGLLLGLLTLIWYSILQVRWFTQHLGRGALSGIGHAGVGIAESLVVVVLLGALFV